MTMTTDGDIVGDIDGMTTMLTNVIDYLNKLKLANDNDAVHHNISLTFNMLKGIR